jgi:hypothetical protein
MYAVVVIDPLREALAFHYAQLEASAFRDEFDPSAFEDATRPKIDMIHKVCSSFLYRFIRT